MGKAGRIQQSSSPLRSQCWSRILSRRWLKEQHHTTDKAIHIFSLSLNPNSRCPHRGPPFRPPSSIFCFHFFLPLWSSLGSGWSSADAKSSTFVITSAPFSASIHCELKELCSSELIDNGHLKTSYGSWRDTARIVCVPCKIVWDSVLDSVFLASKGSEYYLPFPV